MRFIPAVSAVQIRSPLLRGPMVKRLRHRPFTAITRVRVPVGSLKKKIYGSLAQLGEHLPYKQRVIGSSPIVSIQGMGTHLYFRESLWRKRNVPNIAAW